MSSTDTQHLAQSISIIQHGVTDWNPILHFRALDIVFLHNFSFVLTNLHLSMFNPAHSHNHSITCFPISVFLKTTYSYTMKSITSHCVYVCVLVVCHRTSQRINSRIDPHLSPYLRQYFKPMSFHGVSCPCLIPEVLGFQIHAIVSRLGSLNSMSAQQAFTCSGISIVFY